MARQALLLTSPIVALAIALGGCALATDTDASSPAPGDTAEHAEDGADGTDGPSAADADVDLPAPAPESVGPVLEATVGTESGPMPIKYRVIGDDPIAEGDMIVPVGVKSATMIGRHWPRAVVPFVIDVNLPAPERITASIAHWESKTKLRFVPRTTERDYIHFRSNASACSSNIGQVGDAQYVNVMTGEDASTVAAVGIDRTTTPETAYYFYKRGFGTSGSVTRAASVSPHFKYLLPSGQVVTSLVDVAFAKNGHLFAWYTDGTVSEGDAFDFARYAPPKPYTLATGKRPTDVAGLGIDASDRAHAFYTDGTFSVGSVTALQAFATPQRFTVAPGKSVADLTHVDIAANGAFVAYYNRTGTLQNSIGTAAQLAVTSGSTLGRTGFTGSCSTGSMIHELGHAVGLFHEQTRHDRDQYIKIVFENIDPDSIFNFERHSRMVGTDTGAYDFGSVMHYGPTAFSKNGQRTIVRVDGSSFTQQRNGLSPGDIAGVRAMYP